MYKFPVTKNGKEYGVSIVKDYNYREGYWVWLYKKKKILCFYKKVLIVSELFTFEPKDNTYLEMLQAKTLYKQLAESVISKYETKHSKDSLYEDNESEFMKWDGVL